MMKVPGTRIGTARILFTLKGFPPAGGQCRDYAVARYAKLYDLGGGRRRHGTDRREDQEEQAVACRPRGETSGARVHAR